MGRNALKVHFLSVASIADIDTGVLICPEKFFKWQFPKLDLRLVNNSSKTVFVTNVILDVAKSVLDPSPVILLPKSEPNIFHFALLNVGWGSIQDSLVRYNLIPWGQSFSFDGIYPYEVSIRDYLENPTWCECEYYNIDVSEALKRNGVKVEAFGTRDPSDSTNGFNANFMRARFFYDSLCGNEIDPEKYSNWEKELLPRFMTLLYSLRIRNGLLEHSSPCQGKMRIYSTHESKQKRGQHDSDRIYARADRRTEV